jgi:putative oxidoreductase
MKAKLPLIARILLGLIFFVFGLNGFLNFIPTPPDLPENMKTFMEGMTATGFMFPLVKGTEVVAGALLLSGYFVPLALIMLAPVIVNIFLVHVFMAPSGMPMAIVIAALEIYLAFFAKPYSPIVKQVFRCPKREGLK